MSSRSENFRRVLGRVVQQDFVGRVAELDRILAQAERANAGRGRLHGRSSYITRSALIIPCIGSACAPRL